MAAIAPQESSSVLPADAVGVAPQHSQPQQEALIAQPPQAPTPLAESLTAHQRFRLSPRCMIGVTIMALLTIVISAVIVALSKGHTEDNGVNAKLPGGGGSESSSPAGGHADGSDAHSPAATTASPSIFIDSPRKLACIFTLGATTNDSYPEDGVCDFAIYAQLYYRPGGPPGRPQMEPRPSGGLLIFFQKSIEYSRTIFLAAFAPETQTKVSNFNSTHFATHVQNIMGLSNIKGFGVIAEYYTADWFSDRRDNLVEFLEVLRMLLNGTDDPLVFFGAKLYGMPNVTESSKYTIALNDTLRKPVLFILVTHVGSNSLQAPEPTAAWSSNSFNNKDMPTLKSAVLLLKSLQLAPDVTVFLSLTLGVVQYKGTDNSDNPVALGTTYKGRSTELYREGCIEPGFVTNNYDPNEMAAFEVNTQQKVDRCYETVHSIADKVNRVLSEAGMVEAGWALFNAELEDNSNTNECSGGHPTFPRIRAVRRVLDANAATFVPH